MYARMDGWTDVCMCECMDGLMYVCMYVCIYVGDEWIVCLYVWMMDVCMCCWKDALMYVRMDVCVGGLIWIDVCML